MTSKHTPGPWEIGPTNSLGHRNIGTFGNPVALVYNPIVPQDQAIANARLIASAPDMLAALRDVLEILRDSWGEDMPEALHNTICAILARIGGDLTDAT